jgi:polysaccharide deacetylase 2 family uncharacterized protein YibQ
VGDSQSDGRQITLESRTPVTNNRRIQKKNSQGGARYAALAILCLIVLVVGGYLVFNGGAPAPPAPAKTDLKVSKDAAQNKQPASDTTAPLAHQPRTSAKKHPARVTDPPDSKPTTAGPRQLAIIIDDMGSSLQEARSLAGIGVPLTFSIIPGLRNYREVAAFAASSGIETMIHIPMQSKGWPERRIEANGLLVSMPAADITARMDEFIRLIPGAVGANNHMGSEFSEHEDKMRAVLGVLKGKGLFFVDSVTSSATVGIRLAKELDMKSGRRNVFLDNEQNDAYIKGQISQAVQLARKNGRAIAICHPHPATIQTLASVLPELHKQGITIVPASQLVR